MSLVRPPRHARRTRKEKKSIFSFRPRTTSKLMSFRRRSYFSDINKRGNRRWKGCPQFGHGNRFKVSRTLGWSNPGPIYLPTINSLGYEAKKAREKSKKKRILRNRFLNKRSKTPGPGTYELPSDFTRCRMKITQERYSRKRKKGRGRFPFTASSPRIPKARKSFTPGPAHYSLQSVFQTREFSGRKVSVSRRRKSSPCFRSHVGSRSERFKLHKEEIPGPGSYDLDDIMNFVHYPYGKI